MEWKWVAGRLRLQWAAGGGRRLQRAYNSSYSDLFQTPNNEIFGSDFSSSIFATQPSNFPDPPIGLSAVNSSATISNLIHLKLDAMEISNETAVKKPKRLTSVVWNHFERVRKADVCYAVCVHCNKKLSGSSNSGTTHLRNHLMRCLKRSNYDVSQLLSAKRKRKDTNVAFANITFDEGQKKDEYVKPIMKYDPDERKDEVISLGSSRFDQERSRHDLAHMIILHGYPLTMVDHVGFKVFVKNLQPMFEVVPNSVMENSCMEIYEKEKQKMNDMLSKLHSRINLAVEIWSSAEKVEYLCLTAHYIDENWRLQKKILNFVTLDSSHTEDMLPEVIIRCLMDWNVDNALEALREVTQKIRGSIRYVKSSQVTQGKFAEISQQVEINSQRSLVLDCPIRWNSTYAMLETALEYRNVFNVLQENDSEYFSALTDIEWEWASSITGYLKLFVEITNVFSGNRCPTANIYFAEICDVHIQLIDWCKSPDEFLSSTALKMKAKFDKYWSKCSLALAMAAILDPRFKMKLVEYYYSQIYGSTALERIKEVSDGIKELFNAYSICSTLVDQGSALPGSSLPSTESAFSTEGRLLDNSRSSLNPDTRQALICAQDWLRTDNELNPSSSHYALTL
ncbi:hypothetical protein LWI28_025323 [Acer negundo]|uniref:BED-type domain-containing protein n=1 Tax=Acer negundo TaxID=4023 RepID=A0AAD5JBC9_ACENE|nr:hypothetical protein LWI28_025323 [Acer negundo]